MPASVPHPLFIQ